MANTVERLMNQPDLTGNIEKKLLSLIDAAEDKAENEGHDIDAKLYLQLADLYHFHKKFKDEASVLQRFTRFEHGKSGELVEIYDRIEHVASLVELTPEVKEESAPLSLVPDEGHDEEEKISISSEKEVKRRINEGRQPFRDSTLKVLTLSAAYTGISDSDEIVQVAMVLFEYTPQRMKKGKIIGSYWGERKTKVTVPKKVANQFNFSLTEKEVFAFDKEKAMELFQQADFIVSHNDAEVERKLMATLIPEIVGIQWYSSERDIPWRAMGFDTQRLTQLAGSIDEKIPRTCMDRAMVICRMLQKNEPYSSHVYLERLYNMQPMKAFEWTPELQKTQRRLSKSSKSNSHWIAISVVLIVAAALTGYFYFTGII